MSFSLIYQTFPHIAAHLVTQSISWQVLGNISNFSRNNSFFPLFLTFSRLFPLIIRKCKNLEKPLFLFGYSFPRLLGNFKEM